MKFLFRLSLVVLCAIALTACFTKRWTWHQKLTVEVLTPDGTVSGAAVAEVAWNDVNSMHNYPGSYAGEATVVDLGEGRYLFALLGEYTRYLALRTFNGNPRVHRDVFIAMEKVRGSRIVPSKHYPLLVTFDDIHNPTTVKKVDPNNLAATFGAGYALTKITLEITDEAVNTDRVEEVLGWLREYRNNQFRLNGQRCVACPIDDTFAASIGTGSFKIGG